MVNVALFPIPNSVTFPWVPCPLHVFEPRYRKMVRHCIDQRLLLGVCHTDKVLHANTRSQTAEQALNSNQSTYKPHPIFSAGPVELLEEMDDGRLFIQVDTNVRLQLQQEQQTLPFSIWACEELHDEVCDVQEVLIMEQTKAKILHRLLILTHDNESVQEVLTSDYWQTMDAQKFSFAVAGLMAMQPDVAQYLLEMTDAQQRLDTVLDMINRIR